MSAALRSEVLSPELVLVDARLAEHARSLLDDGDDTVARLARPLLVHVEPVTEPSEEVRTEPDEPAEAKPTASHMPVGAAADGIQRRDDEVWSALRRLSESGLEAEPATRTRSRARILLLGAIVLVLAATAGLALLDVRAPASEASPVETSIVGERASDAADAARAETQAPTPTAAPVEPEAEPARATVPLPEARETRDPASASRPQAQAEQKSAPVPSPPPDATAIAREFQWEPVRRASGYHVELVRGGARVFVTDVPRATVTIPATWDLGGRTQRIDPGDQLYVWPVVDGRRSSAPLVDGVLVVDFPIFVPSPPNE